MKKHTKLWILLAVLAVLLVAAVGVIWTLNHYVISAWHFYPKGQKIVDIRNREITELEFDELQSDLPETEIIWNVPFQGSTVSSNVTELTVSRLSGDDVEALDYLNYLTAVHAEGCTDYDALLSLQSRRPEVAVTYTVTLGENTYPQDTETVTVPDLDEAQAALLQYLPSVKTVDADGCRNYALLAQLEEDHPDWELNYKVAIAGEEFARTVTQIAVNNPEYEELATAIAALPNLKTVQLRNPNAEAAQMEELLAANPDVDIKWEVDVFGLTFTSEDEEIDLTGAEVGSTEAVKEALKSLPKVTLVNMTDCGIKDETMAAFREEMRSSYKVVWTVYFSKNCKARTDDKIFMPIKQGEWYFRDKLNAKALKYCEEMECIDVGHATIKNCDWLAYMPHLKYLILAHTCVTDISAISNCKELVFLELDWSTVKDYSPLVECTALEDLNLGNTFCDWKPILKMTWLKHLWWNCRNNYTMRVELDEALPNTQIMTGGKLTVSNGWRNLPNYYAMRDALGMPYMIG